MYAMAGYAASIDAQRELDCFVREVGGAGLKLRAYILVMFSLLAGLGVSVAVAALFGYIWWFITDDSAGELLLILSSPLKNGGQTNRTGRRSGAAALAACPPKTLSCHKLRQRNVFGRQNSDPRFERERRFASARVQKLV